MTPLRSSYRALSLDAPAAPRPARTLVLVAAAVASLMLSAFVVVTPGLPSSAAEEGPAPECQRAVADTFEEAAALAEACEVRVEVVGERTPWETSYVLPDGQSQLVLSTMPTVTDVNGEWEPVDLGIDSVPDTDGMLSVEAPVMELKLSGGDGEGQVPSGAKGQAVALQEAVPAKPLGTITSGDHTFRLWFPLDLPEPVIEGSRATYELAPGVRVVNYISPSGSGFTPIIELDDRAAAQWLKMALAEARAERGLPGNGYDIPFAMEFDDSLTGNVLDGGAVHFTDASGEPIFQAPPAYMWDSSGALPTDPPIAGEDTALEPLSGERAEWAWPGDVVSQMPVRIEGSTMTITPDAAVLESEDTQYPVHIDPAISGHKPAEWTMLRTGGYTSSMWKFTDLSASYPGGGVGRCVGADSCGVSYYIGRLVWEFTGLTTVANLDENEVTSAYLNVGGISSYNCTAAATQVWHTGSISSASTWSTVSFSILNSTRTEAQRDGCSQGPGTKSFNITAAAKKAAGDDSSQMTVGLKAADESTMAGWKRFNHAATLTVNYNRTPAVPSAVSLKQPVASCLSGENRPVINDSTPTIQAKVSDPDGGSVQSRFRVVRTSDGATVWTSELVATSSGSTPSAPVASALAQGTYRYQAQTTDGTTTSGWSGTGCEFTVDTAAPAAPSIVVAGSPPAADRYEGPAARGGIGVPGSFTFASTSTDTTRFEYSMGSDLASTPVTAVGASATVTITPQSAGPKTITVDAYDKAGNHSTSTYSFNVAYPKASSVWKFDENAGSQVLDTSGTAPPRTLTITASGWGPGAAPEFAIGDGYALKLNGTSTAAMGVPAVNTAASFTISARVKLDAAKIAAGATYTAVSQDGAAVSGFRLGYRSACAGTGTPSCWAFSVPGSDSAAASLTTVKSAAAAVGDRWVGLVASYDASVSPKQLKIWTCDIGTGLDPGENVPVAAQQTISTTAWAANGSFAVGRGRQGAAAAEYWPGLIDDVRVFDGQVVDVAKAGRLCNEFDPSITPADPTTGGN